MMAMLATTLLWAAMPPAAAATLDVVVAKATLDVVVANVRDGRGRVRVAACTAETFLKPSCQVNGEAEATAGEVTVTLELAPGTWAVQAYQDEDENHKIGTNLFGIPNEGLGFSNDAPFRFGPPSFADAAFRLIAGRSRIRLNLRYF